MVIAAAVYSAITGEAVEPAVAMTGELSIRGEVKPVGGIVPKVEAARLAGCQRVFIPRDNWQELFREQSALEVVPIATPPGLAGARTGSRPGRKVPRRARSRGRPPGGQSTALRERLAAGIPCHGAMAPVPRPGHGRVWR